MDWSHPGHRPAGGHHEPHAASLRRRRAGEAEPHRRQRVPLLRRDALVRLQRVLLLRELGLGIPAIGEVLAGQRDDTVALRTHLEWLASGAGAARPADRQRRAHHHRTGRR